MSRAIKIGLAEATITPPLGVRMAGFAARKGVAQGVHDDLHVRALVVEGPETSLAILGAAIIGLPRDMVEEVRRTVAGQTGIPERNILMAATHTHSGPVVSDDYRPLLRDQCVAVLLSAWERRTPGRLGAGTTEVDDVSRNRRRLDYGALPVDPEIGILRLEDSAGRPLGVLFHYSCHPTVMGPDNLMITQDWPYYAIRRIRQEVGDVPVIYLNGAEGDQNPGYRSELSAVGAPIPIRVWEFAEKMGTRVGDAVLAALPGIGTRAECALRGVSGHVDLPLRDTFPITIEQAERAAKEARERLAAVEAQGEIPSPVLLHKAQAEAFMADLTASRARWFYTADRGRSIDVELQSLLLDDAVFTTFPGEVFVEIGLAVKERSPFAKTFPVGLSALGSAGYMPTRAAFAEGDYEVYASGYREDAGDKLVEATLGLIEQLRAA
ncbi:MAG: neutral/alkaline non-lysosomal ceramidase N-terminal domain-containing protein [Armatimonadetes bacterium]|nr:neutral/alkaline non-lysosomal ceramidase N-terminal domain-containing protein [Armatimonadota bacterium]